MANIQAPVPKPRPGSTGPAKGSQAKMVGHKVTKVTGRKKRR